MRERRLAQVRSTVPRPRLEPGRPHPDSIALLVHCAFNFEKTGSQFKRNLNILFSLLSRLSYATGFRLKK